MNWLLKSMPRQGAAEVRDAQRGCHTRGERTIKVRRMNSAVWIAGVLVAMTVVAVPAEATGPGQNGLISYRRYFNVSHTSGNSVTGGETQ